MIDDLRTVLWKEWRENILQYGSVTRWLLNMGLLVGLVGIFLPLQFGRTTIESITLLFWLWIPLLTVTNSIADTIAGERERHTLETLLTTRLPDQAILIGKMAVPVLQSWVGMLIAACLALVTVNLTKGEGQLIMYPLPVVFGLIVLPLLTGILFAGMGVASSAHALTVRQAYQRMVIPLFAFCLIPGIAISLLSGDRLVALYSLEFAQTGFGGLILIISLALIGLDTAILTFIFKRFRRSKILVD